MTKLKLLFAVLLFVNTIFSQEKTITGTVTSDGIPLAGAVVVLKGTQTGTQTDENGKYSIKANQGDILEFSYLGYDTKSTTVGESNIINIALTESNKTLEYVVVAGYSSGLNISRSKQKAPLKVSKISNSKIEVPITFSDEITKLSSKEFQTKNEPLFYIDGVKATKKELDLIDNKKIDEIKVIKVEDAIKVFGKKGKNGVIIVETDESDYLSVDELNTKIEEKKVVTSTLDFDDLQEEYESYVENQFENSTSNPLSTFSIDVDNASYTNIRRLINSGDDVPKDAVRIEEMMNFFKYSYKQPKGNNPFSINSEYGDCPWNTNHKLLKIGLQGTEITSSDLPNSNFVFLIDVSGSMDEEDKLPLVIQSLKALTNQLRKEDKISIVVYAGAAGLVLPTTSGNDKEKIIAALENLEAGGSTAGGAGIQLAYKIAEENFIKGGNNRVIIATDGDFNVGASSDGDMVSLIEEKRKSGLFLTCLGYGMGNYKDSKLEKLADKGNGNYAYIDNMQEANRFLVKEFKGSMFAIAKDVKIQIEFNPKHVQNYRLIGYENRKLRNEDFTNDAIDAGELGSGHTVTALYEIIPAGVKSNFSTEPIDLKYSNTKVNNTISNELATIKFRYKKPDGNKSIEIVQTIDNTVQDLETCSEDFKFCSAVAWFGLKLRDSKLVENKNKDEIIELASKSKTNDLDGYKSEFIRLVEAAD